MSLQNNNRNDCDGWRTWQAYVTDGTVIRGVTTSRSITVLRKEVANIFYVEYVFVRR
jgi:hypothetical protein